MTDLWLDFLSGLYNFLRSDPENGSRLRKWDFSELKKRQFCKDNRKFLNGGCDLQILTSKRVCKQFEIDENRFDNPNSFLEQFQSAFRYSIFSIESCQLFETQISVKFHRFQIIEHVLNAILSDQSNYGDFRQDKQICLICDVLSDKDSSLLNLTELRLNLFLEIAENLFRKNGYTISNQAKNKIRITLENHGNFEGGALIKCGPVLNSKTKQKDLETTSQQFYANRKAYMAFIGAQRYGLNNDVEINWENLGEAAVISELMRPKINHGITVDTDIIQFSRGKGIVFVLYNYARMISILNKFSEKFTDLSIPKKIDVESLNEEEEWYLIYDYLLKYPYLIRNSIENEINIGHIFSFVEGFCSLFSVYYRRIKILSEPRSPQLSQMYARISFLKAAQIVLHNALTLLRIQPLDFM